jgi:hypothetical protein
LRVPENNGEYLIVSILRYLSVLRNSQLAKGFHAACLQGLSAGVDAGRSVSGGVLMAGLTVMLERIKEENVRFFMKIASASFICGNPVTNINCNNSLILPV